MVIPQNQEMQITLSLSERDMQELHERFAEEKREHIDLTVTQFVSAAVKYYLQHAYLPPNDNKYYRG